MAWSEELLGLELLDLSLEDCKKSHVSFSWESSVRPSSLDAGSCLDLHGALCDDKMLFKSCTRPWWPP